MERVRAGEAFQLCSAALAERLVFGNAVRLWGDVNPEFFAGTAIASAIAA